MTLLVGRRLWQFVVHCLGDSSNEIPPQCGGEGYDVHIVSTKGGGALILFSTQVINWRIFLLLCNVAMSAKMLSL